MNFGLNNISKNTKNIDIIQIYLADGSFKNVRVDSYTTIRRIITVVLDGLGIDQLSFSHFALCLNAFTQITSASQSNDCNWLHPSLKIPQVQRRYIDKAPTGIQLRYELRIRFFINDICEMYQTKMVAFLYLYEQLTVDYIRHIAWKIDSERAFEMCALTIRKRFPNLTNFNLEKKLDFNLIEKEGGLIKYLPESLIIKIKRKTLQKMIISAVRKVIELTEMECVFCFIKNLSNITLFNTEIFRASLGTTWQDPVDVYVNYESGITYFSEQNRVQMKITDFANINNISVHRLDLNSKTKALVKLKLNGITPLLTFTLPTLNLAESFAHLIDGYRFLVIGELQNKNENYDFRYNSAWQLTNEHKNYELDLLSVWESKDIVTQLSPLIANCSLISSYNKNLQQNDKRCYNANLKYKYNNEKYKKSTSNSFSISPQYKKIIFNFNEIMNEPFEEHICNMVRELNIERSTMRLGELLGDGQFGNVYKGFYENAETLNQSLPVAVKICKANNEFCDTKTANKYLLDEAYRMTRFCHPHIIKLIGVIVSNSIVWIVMELAELGELRSYLQREKAYIDLFVQIKFIYQLASALSYLHDRQFLHRDVAARNCVVTNPKCIKLSDFGLSRKLEDCHNSYTASYGKLPIKWLPPESINDCYFSIFSDVYMFGVCAWEILMFGLKPWQNVQNNEVITRVERGERLRRPENCPKFIYTILMSTWSLKPIDRPTMIELKNFFADLLSNEKLNSNKYNYKNSNYGNKKLIEMNDYTNITFTSTPNKKRSNSTSARLQKDNNFLKFNLWRTLEQQKAQCDEDDKWLEEEEQRLLPPSAFKARSFHSDNLREKSLNNLDLTNFTVLSSNNVNQLPLKHTKSIQDIFNINENKLCDRYLNEIPGNVELDRTDDQIFLAVVHLIELISQLSKKFLLKLHNIKFLDLIKKIESAAICFLNECAYFLKNLNEIDQKKVLLMEKLVESDLKNLIKIVENNTNTYKQSNRLYDFHQREVLHMLHLLAVNSKNLLDLIDSIRIDKGFAQFKPKIINL